jgi:hypothetical protein
LSPRRAAALLLILAATAGLGPPMRAEEGKALSFGGYVKIFSLALLPPAQRLGDGWISTPALGAVVNRLRLTMAYAPSPAVSFSLAYDFAPRIQDRRLWDGAYALSGMAPPDYRFDDLRGRLYPGPDRKPESFGIMQNLDRCMATFKLPAADIIVGRQPIAWGSGRLVNPTDVLAPFSFNELDKEERRGVDAIRVRVPLGEMDELDVGAVAGDGFAPANNAFYVRGKVHGFKTDIAGLAMAFRGHLLLGLDLARSIGGAGSWLEAAVVVPGTFRRSGSGGEKSYVRATAGLDYTFRGGTYGFIEYHFNSAGGADPDAYPGRIGTTAYADGATYLLGRHYLDLGATWQATPLLPVTGLVIVNLTDGSFVLAPSADYNVAEDIDLAMGAYLGVGRRPETAAVSLPSGRFRSEFGSYPGMVYASFRVYF